MLPLAADAATPPLALQRPHGPRPDAPPTKSTKPPGEPRAAAAAGAAAGAAEGSAVAGRVAHGIACHPTELSFATVGPDGYLRVWSLPGGAGGRGLALLGMQQLPRACSCVAFDAAGERIAAAEATAAAGDQPRFFVLSARGLLLLHEADAGPRGGGGGGVHALRFSPSGAILALGGSDGVTYLFDASQRFTPLAALTTEGGGAAHAAEVTAIDWAAGQESMLLRSGCAAGGLRFWDATAGRRVAEAAGARRKDWVRPHAARLAAAALG